MFPIVVAVLASVKLRAFPATVASFLGLISYGVYVLHMPLTAFAVALNYRFTQRLAFPPYWPAITLVCILALGCLLLDRYYDRPLRRWLA